MRKCKKLLAMMIAVTLSVAATMTAFAAAPTILEAEKVFAGSDIVVYDTTKEAVKCVGTDAIRTVTPDGRGISFKIPTYYFFSADGKKLGSISGDAHTAIVDKYKHIDPDGSTDWSDWFSDMFNSYRLSDSVRTVTLTEEVKMADKPIQAAPENHPLKEKINAIKLEPYVTADWSADFYTRINKVATDQMTVYEKMWAVYDDIAVNYNISNTCVSYAVQLQCALKAVGFETYYIRGEVTTTDGGWTAHSWVGVLVDGKLIYFDANLPGKYGASADKYFAVSRKEATYYRNAYIRVLEINPDGNAWKVLDAYEIPESML